MKPLPMLLLLSAATALAQGLPPPPRTVYRCEADGKVSYSDAPCLGARKVDVEPTRGMNKSTGKVLTGSDVEREHRQEQLADGVKPLTGLDARQLQQSGRRLKPSPQAQRQCQSLDRLLPAAEAAEQSAAASAPLAAAQARLLSLRTAYRELRCE